LEKRHARLDYFSRADLPLQRNTSLFRGLESSSLQSIEQNLS